MTSRSITRSLAALCVFAAVGCDPAPEPPDNGDGRAATFDEVFAVFDDSGCATAGCHGGDTIAADLDLDGPQIAHAALVDVPCANTEADASGLLRVQTGDSGASFLLTKLALTHNDAMLGLPMPPTGAPLTDDDLNLVKRWIDAGAPAPQQ